MKFGDYEVLKTFEHFMIGFNSKKLQPYVTWNSNTLDVDNAVFHSTYEGAYKDVELRKSCLKTK